MEGAQGSPTRLYCQPEDWCRCFAYNSAEYNVFVIKNATFNNNIGKSIVSDTE